MILKYLSGIFYGGKIDEQWIQKYYLWKTPKNTNLGGMKNTKSGVTARKKNLQFGKALDNVSFKSFVEIWNLTNRWALGPD